MKKFSVGLLFVLSTAVNAQEISFSAVAYKSWDEAERAEKMFALFEDEVPIDEDLYDLVTKLSDANVLDVNMRSKNGKLTIFDACLESGRYMTAKLLVEKGYKINQRCFPCNGETPLLRAIYVSGDMDDPNPELYELMSFMIEKGADPDLRDMKGFTSLHWVIKNKDIGAFEVLMGEGVVLNSQLGTMKGKGYLDFFDKHWDEDEYREMLMTKTELKYPPTKKEIKAREKAAKEKEKAKKEKVKDEKEKSKKEDQL